MNDLDFIRKLATVSVICPDCKNRLVVDNHKFSHKRYCHCPNQLSPADNIQSSGGNIFQ